MEKEEYENLFRQSWIDLKNNLVVFVPNIFMFIISLGLVFLFFAGSGILSYLQNQPIFFREYPVSELFMQAPLKILILFLVYAVLEFLVAAFFSTMKYSMAKEIAEKGSTSLKTGWSFGKKFFLKLLRLELLVVAILFAPLILLFVLNSVAFSTEYVTGTFFMIVFILIFAIYFIYMLFHILFVYPVLFFEKKHTIITLKKEFHYVKTHFIHTMISWLLITGVLLIAYFVGLPFDAISNYSSKLFLVLLAFLAIYILEIIFSSWEHIFVMKAYLLGKKEKEQ